MSYFDDPLSGKNPWMPRHDAYGNGTVVHEVVIEDTEKIRAWKEHAAKLQEGFATALNQRNAWRATCRTIRDKYVPELTNEEVFKIYDEKEKEVSAENIL